MKWYWQQNGEGDGEGQGGGAEMAPNTQRELVERLARVEGELSRERALRTDAEKWRDHNATVIDLAHQRWKDAEQRLTLMQETLDGVEAECREGWDLVAELDAQVAALNNVDNERLAALGQRDAWQSGYNEARERGYLETRGKQAAAWQEGWDARTRYATRWIREANPYAPKPQVGATGAAGGDGDE